MTYDRRPRESGDLGRAMRPLPPLGSRFRRNDEEEAPGSLRAGGQ
jgi:hypothetical protein